LGKSIRFGHISWDIDGPAVKGGDVLRHAMKNELVKMSLCSRNIETLGLKLKDESFPRSIRENAKNIQVSADYLLQLMKRVQDYTREITLVESNANLFEILEEAINLVQIYLQTQQITIQRNFLQAQMNFFLLCDMLHLKEVIRNILQNAIDAMGKGGQIRINILQTRKHFILEISDNGCGISKQNLPYVVLPYFSTKKNTLNFGLGLSYCCNVMKKHGGLLVIESTKGEGTKVFLKFPAKKLLWKTKN
jgi:signal transduction histidine kinase